MNEHEYKVERTNPNDEFVIVGSWRVNSGESVKAGEIVCSLEATKNNYDIVSPVAGYIFYSAGKCERVDVGTILFVVSDDPGYKFGKVARVAVGTESRLTRKARKLADAHKINVKDLLAGKTQVGEDDVRAYIHQKNISPARVNDGHIGAGYVEEDITPTKVFEVHFMSQACDVLYSRVVHEVPSDIVARVMNAQTGPTLGEIVSFATISAFRQYPCINACYAANRVRMYTDYNVGVAMNLGLGLKVPIIKAFDKLTLSEVSYKFRETSMKYVREELTGADLIDGTFTITDLSSFEVRDFHPVVLKDQCAILGIGSISKATSTFNLVLGFDHRVIDGMYAAKFLSAVETAIKDL